MQDVYELVFLFCLLVIKRGSQRVAEEISLLLTHCERETLCPNILLQPNTVVLNSQLFSVQNSSVRTFFFHISPLDCL